jgi:hypothetical protein
MKSTWVPARANGLVSDQNARPALMRISVTILPRGADAEEKLLATQPAHAAAERQAGHAGAGDSAGGGGQTIRLRRGREFAQRHPRLHPRDQPKRIDRALRPLSIVITG